MPSPPSWGPSHSTLNQLWYATVFLVKQIRTVCYLPRISEGSAGIRLPWSCGRRTFRHYPDSGRQNKCVNKVFKKWMWSYRKEQKFTRWRKRKRRGFWTDGRVWTQAKSQNAFRVIDQELWSQTASAWTPVLPTLPLPRHVAWDTYPEKQNISDSETKRNLGRAWWYSNCGLVQIGKNITGVALVGGNWELE